MAKLPCEILCDILSRSNITTLDAMRATIFKRGVWQSIRSLHFDLDQFADENRFCEFVDFVISVRDSSLDKFQLSCADFVDEVHGTNVARYVAYALNNNVRVLQLTVNVNCDMPYEVLKCPSLEELDISVYKGMY